jgi:hypothetical protein
VHHFATEKIVSDDEDSHEIISLKKPVLSVAGGTVCVDGMTFCYFTLTPVKCGFNKKGSCSFIRGQLYGSSHFFNLSRQAGTVSTKHRHTLENLDEVLSVMSNCLSGILGSPKQRLLTMQ